MGVYAEMFARIKGCENWLRPEHETEAAQALASTFGYDQFLIGEQHALAIIEPVTERSIEYSDDIIGKVVWLQDGDPIVADEDEQFIRVNILTRYYSENYGNGGNWPIIRAVAEWLEWRFPSCEVWYGGDSSGVCAALLDANRRKELNDYFFSSYRRSRSLHPDHGA